MKSGPPAIILSKTIIGMDYGGTLLLAAHTPRRLPDPNGETTLQKRNHTKTMVRDTGDMSSNIRTC
jgi:hypothetical protein